MAIAIEAFSLFRIRQDSAKGVFGNVKKNFGFWWRAGVRLKIGLWLIDNPRRRPSPLGVC